MELLISENEHEAELIDDPIASRQDNDVIPINQQSEMGEVLDKAYTQSDIFDKESNTSTIDFWSRIPPIVESFIIRFEASAQMGVIPKNAIVVTRSAKRNYVSRDGAGRKEAVQIIAGKRELEAETSGFGSSVKNWFQSRFKANNQQL